LRKKIGDDGSHYPASEKIVQEFWDYDAADREKARKISSEFLQRRLESLKTSKNQGRNQQKKKQ
jgi:hypothetical protein